MSHKILFAKSAAKDYKIINEPFKSQIDDAINKLEEFGLDIPNMKPLTGEFKGYYRVRSGDYRIVFFVSEEEITIVSILHRKEVYKKKK